MGIIDFDIVFERPSGTYFPGEAIKGELKINLDDSKSFKNIKVELFGGADVHWIEQRTQTVPNGDGSSRQETITENYSNHETYIENEMIVHTGPELSAGIHYIPFNFLLPPNLPSSFEGSDGQVRYYIKAEIVRDWKWNHRVKQHFMVNGILDLNIFPSAKDEGNSRADKKLCCLCCTSGPISAEISTDRSGYVPGEVIGFRAEVENLSRRDMKRSILQLLEIVTYKAAWKSKSSTRIVTEIERGEINARGSDYWDGEVIRVPAVPPTSLAGNCSIIDVQYMLHFRVEPSGPAFDLIVSVPIIIGTIPLKQYIPTLLPPPDGGTVPPLPSYETPDPEQSPFAPSAPPTSDQFKLYPSLPPPSYTESVWGPANVRHQDDDEHTKGDFQFVPRYPKYSTNY